MQKDRYLDVLLANIFTGTQVDAVIAILIGVCLLLLVLLWYTTRLFLKREKQHREEMSEAQKSLKDSNEKLGDVLGKYMEFAKQTNDQYNEAAQETLKSYQVVSVTLTEVKTLLNTMLLYRGK